MPTKNAASKICSPPYAVSLNNVPRGTPAGAWLTWNFWRAGASAKVKFRFEWCYSRQCTCKSDQSQVFFAGVDKIFFDCASLCRPGPRAHPGIIRARPGIVKNFLVAIVHNFLGCKSAAPIIVQLRSDCQVLFAQLHKINRLTSLCGCAILY